VTVVTSAIVAVAAVAVARGLLIALLIATRPHISLRRSPINDLTLRAIQRIYILILSETGTRCALTPILTLSSLCARRYSLWETITHLTMADRSGHLSMPDLSSVRRHSVIAEMPRNTQHHEPRSFTWRRDHSRTRSANEPQRVHGGYCAKRRLMRDATRHDRSRRLPSAHEALAVVDRPTNNALISSFLRLFPFLLSFATQTGALPFISLPLTLSFSFASPPLPLPPPPPPPPPPLLLLLLTSFPRDRKLNARQEEANRDRHDDDDTYASLRSSSGIAHAS